MQRGVTTPVGSGQGQAFIYDRSNLVLEDPKAPLLFDKYLKQSQDAKLADDKKKAAGGAELKKLMDNSPEYWYRHDSEIQGSMDELYNMGAEILTKGADPFSGTDPASLEFRRKKDKVEKMSKYSTQLKELHGEYFNKIDTGGKEGEKYTKESKDAVARYFETPLSELIANNTEPPRLEIENPAFSILKYDTELAKGVTAAKKDGVEDQDIAAFAVKSLEDPDVNDAVHTQIARMSDTGRQMLTAMAQNQGMTPEAYFRFNQLKPHFQSGVDNFDFLKVEEQMTPGLSSSTIEDGDTTVSSTRLNPKRAEEMANLIVSANPKYVQAGVAAGRFGSPSNTFDQNMAAAVEWNKKRVMAEAKTDYSKTTDEGSGSGKKELMASGNQWYIDITSPDVNKNREAADYIKGLQLEDGSTIEGMETPLSSERLLNDQGTIAFRTIKTYKEDGEMKIERGKFALDKDTDTREFMLRLHDQAFSGPAKKNMYGQSERTVTGPYIPGAQPKQNNIPAYLQIISE